MACADTYYSTPRGHQNAAPGVSLLQQIEANCRRNVQLPRQLRDWSSLLCVDDHAQGENRRGFGTTSLDSCLLLKVWLSFAIGVSICLY